MNPLPFFHIVLSTFIMQIIYIHHDCFLVLTSRFSLLFDYWTDPLSPDPAYPQFLSLIPQDKPFFVFVSHHHKDHYSKYIFGWADRFPYIHYILSNDTARFCRHILSPNSIYAGPRPTSDSVATLRPSQHTVFPLTTSSAHDTPDHVNSSESPDTLIVRAFGSTDIGNSWIVETPALRIFHAGDLNAWIWKDESTQQEVNKALGDFNHILDTIAEYVESRPIDICFFPVDSRIGSDYFTGARLFLQRFNIKNFFPMHFGLGDDAEQLRRRRDAAQANLYLPAGKESTIIGPLAPYGRIASSL